MYYDVSYNIFYGKKDWCLEASWKFYNLIEPIQRYTVETMIDDPNILRDSILIRLENLRFEAYVHVCASMWIVAFRELRGLTNIKKLEDSGMALNPMELNDLYDCLWAVGDLLNSDNCLSIFEPEYRPWPIVRLGQEYSCRFYSRIERRKQEEVAELSAYNNKADIDVYLPIFKQILGLFGEAVHSSLQYTMGKYLAATNGDLRNDLRPEWQLDKVCKLLCTNNPAERPFAIAKAYLKFFPTLKLITLGNFSLASANGSHRPARTVGKTRKTKDRLVAEAGIALTSHATLKMAVTKVCGVRKVKRGKVTDLLRTTFKENSELAHQRRLAKEERDRADTMRRHAKKGVEWNTNMEEPLASSKVEIKTNIPNCLFVIFIPVSACYPSPPCLPQSCQDPCKRGFSSPPPPIVFPPPLFIYLSIL